MNYYSKIEAIGKAYGEDSRHYVDAVASLIHCIEQANDHSLIVWQVNEQDMVALRGLYGADTPEVGIWVVR